MPAHAPIPTLDQFLDAYAASIRAEAGTERNVRRGSGYDLVGGSSALLWARQAQRTRDVFRQCYTETATGDRFDALALRKYGIARTRLSYGSGTAVFVRPAAGTAGTLYTGTRILVYGTESQPRQYRIAADRNVDASETTVRVSVEPTRPGSGVALRTSSGLRLGDSVFDPTFAPVSLACVDGTDDEDPAAYLVRARQAKLDDRVGYRARIETACRAAGAENVVILDANVFGDDADGGITHVYVADAGYSTPAALLDACALAVDAVHVAGCDVAVLGMAITPVVATVVLTLWDGPGQFNQLAIKRRSLDVLLGEFARRPDFWLFRAAALAGALQDASSEVQRASVSTSPGDPLAAFVPVLPRYTLTGTDVTITLQGPS